ncbi:TetR/AcrR family transcriptional regulator [Advenella mimigardefordensis]|uniref:Transcriptional regulator, TetR family n=1 Tax=Advenella mimigardefordensis (strain DSM 17166 / LMG 22922 / DPN7) TaxID=1247726 RepID=W0PHH5_ADVMD|nr:TetR/AcrR family transcriptional regulator [Advenella mimigardefordensis]AHG65227.1 transcriptional regulator, TetR family [Advenella mimigardefordensis DPN7]
MPQVKKEEVRQAILAAAFDLFCRKGYTATTMAELARTAGMTVANIYIYFDSKLLIFYEIYTPWLLARIDLLRESVRKFPTARTRLQRIFLGLWEDIPAADHSFANAMIEALSTAPRQTLKPNNLLSQCESAITELILECLPPERIHIAQNDLLAHVLWMAYDGFAINGRMDDKRDMDAIANLMTDLLLGASASDLPETSPKTRNGSTKKKLRPSE